jgi:hypothetical protein
MPKGIPPNPKKASSFVTGVLAGKPDLIVHSGDLPATARALRDLLGASEYLFDRDMPVKVVQSSASGSAIAVPLTVSGVVVEAHGLSQPVTFASAGKRVPVTLPDRVARMYLEMVGEWNLPPLAGISTAPLLAANGGARKAEGYDPATGLWCCKVPRLRLPKRPRRDRAEAALKLLRKTFRTFPFADAIRRYDPVLCVSVVDLDHPPGFDESGFLVGLLTAICRASLWLAPGILIIAPLVSGSGSGKGLFVRAICAIAFGIRPRAFTAGGERQELDKRIAAELIQAAPALFLDNVNGAVLRSETLSSVLTERPAQVRVLGETRMVTLNSTAFIAVTGNGLSVSEDLARRFPVSELDAHCEDPEVRPFAPGFLDEIEGRRADLLTAALTIWRWGRQHPRDLVRGRPLGSFETWCEWVRDPLLTLGCRDVVERIEMAKARDPHRQRTAELFRMWWHHHKNTPVTVADLAEPVRHMVDPQGRGRQFLAAAVGKLAGTRAAGFVLTRQQPAGKWSAATYALQETMPEGSDGIGHRDHRGHNPDADTADPPIPDEVENVEAGADEEQKWTL